MYTLVLQRIVRYAPFVVAASAAMLALAHGVHVGVLDELPPGGPN